MESEPVRIKCLTASQNGDGAVRALSNEDGLLVTVVIRVLPLVLLTPSIPRINVSIHLSRM